MGKKKLPYICAAHFSAGEEKKKLPSECDIPTGGKGGGKGPHLEGGRKKQDLTSLRANRLERGGEGGEEAGMMTPNFFDEGGEGTVDGRFKAGRREESEMWLTNLEKRKQEV